MSVEDTGAAQFARDVRETSIDEGTNGIQALDLVGRKMMDDGATAFALLDEMAALAAPADLAGPMQAAVEGMETWMAATAAATAVLETERVAQNGM